MTDVLKIALDRRAVLRFDGVQVGSDRLLGREGEAFATIEKAVDRGAAAAAAEGGGGRLRSHAARVDGTLRAAADSVDRKPAA